MHLPHKAEWVGVYCDVKLVYLLIDSQALPEPQEWNEQSRHLAVSKPHFLFPRLPLPGSDDLPIYMFSLSLLRQEELDLFSQEKLNSRESTVLYYASEQLAACPTSGCEAPLLVHTLPCTLRSCPQGPPTPASPLRAGSPCPFWLCYLKTEPCPAFQFRRRVPASPSQASRMKAVNFCELAS